MLAIKKPNHLLNCRNNGQCLTVCRSPTEWFGSHPSNSLLANSTGYLISCCCNKQAPIPMSEASLWRVNSFSKSGDFRVGSFDKISFTFVKVSCLLSHSTWLSALLLVRSVSGAPVLLHLRHSIDASMRLYNTRVLHLSRHVPIHI